MSPGFLGNDASKSNPFTMANDSSKLINSNVILDKDASIPKTSIDIFKTPNQPKYTMLSDTSDSPFGGNKKMKFNNYDNSPKAKILDDFLFKAKTIHDRCTEAEQKLLFIKERCDSHYTSMTLTCDKYSELIKLIITIIENKSKKTDTAKLILQNTVKLLEMNSSEVYTLLQKDMEEKAVKYQKEETRIKDAKSTIAEMQKDTMVNYSSILIKVNEASMTEI